MPGFIVGISDRLRPIAAMISASVKVRVTSYGHGWEIVLPGSTHATYVVSFEEVWPVFDEFCAQVQVSAWLDIYRMRMGTEAQTRGMA